MSLGFLKLNEYHPASSVSRFWLSSFMYWGSFQFFHSVVLVLLLSLPPFSNDPMASRSFWWILFSSKVFSICIFLVPTLIMSLWFKLKSYFIFSSSDISEVFLMNVLVNHSYTFSVLLIWCASVFPVFRCFTKICIVFRCSFFMVVSAYVFWGIYFLWVFFGYFFLVSYFLLICLFWD